MTGEQALALLKSMQATTAALSAQIECLISSLAPAAASEPSGPRCPKCGSPKFSDLSGMGGAKEYQCIDCGTNYAG